MFDNASQAFKRRNPHLFGVGGLRAGVAEQEQRQALVTPAQEAEGGKAGVVARRVRPTQQVLRITLIRFGKGTLDNDNLQKACKEIRDEVSSWFGLDDSDKGIQWQYGQQQTLGKRGMIVKAELI